MNYKIAKTGLILCVVYLVVFYILKFIFPNILLQAITSPTLLKLGEFINSWVGFEYIIRFITNFVTLYLFACASSGNFKFKAWQFGAITIFVVINNLVCDLLPELYTHTAIVLMLFSAVVVNGKLLYTSITFTIHGYLSQFLLSIRGFETVIIKISQMGLLSSVIVGFEGYVWLLLLAIIFNIKEKKNECNFTTIC